MTAHREHWGSGAGFILATIGAAVGLGNIWRFSYVAGENGGGAFLIIYLCCVVVIGLPIVIAELAVGRRAQGDAVSAFERIAPGSRWALAGWLGAAAGFVILAYYAVIAGWALKYFAGAVTGTLWPTVAQGPGAYFADFISHPLEPIVWQLAMLTATAVIVGRGIQRGIEMASRILMPLLGAIVVGLAAYSLSLPGSSAGWRFLLAPDWVAFTRPQVYLAALGQAFFSIGVGMAVFITYGSYLTRASRIPRSATAIVAGDSLFAVIAGLAVFPAVFAFGIDPAAGPQLAFITLPQLFLAMPGGTITGTVFFFVLVAAALTSMVSLLEVPCAVAVHRLGMSRRTAVVAIGSIVFVIGLAPALSYGVLADVELGGRGILDAMDQTVSSYVLPLGGVLVALFVGWRWSAADALDEADFGPSRAGIVWLWLLRLVVPAAIVLVFVMAPGGD